MVERVIEVSGKEVKFRSSAAVPRLYRAKFKRDIFKDFSKLEKSYKDNANEGEAFAIEDLEIFENAAYTSWLIMPILPSPALSRTGLTCSICSAFTRCFRRYWRCGYEHDDRRCL